jgi:hypothetical protein
VKEELDQASRNFFLQYKPFARWHPTGVAYGGSTWEVPDMAGTVTKARADTGADRQIAVCGDWAILTDGVQWIVARRKGPDGWRGVSFVRSDRSILRRCLREKGADVATVDELTAGLPTSFDDWKAAQDASQEAAP